MKSFQLLVYHGRLKDGVRDAYKSAHDAISADIVRIYRRHGISDIHIYESNGDLLMVVFLDAGMEISVAVNECLKYPEMVAWLKAMDGMFADNGAWEQVKPLFRFPSD